MRARRREQGGGETDGWKKDEAWAAEEKREREP